MCEIGVPAAESASWIQTEKMIAYDKLITILKLYSRAHTVSSIGEDSYRVKMDSYIEERTSIVNNLSVGERACLDEFLDSNCDMIDFYQ